MTHRPWAVYVLVVLSLAGLVFAGFDVAEPVR